MKVALVERIDSARRINKDQMGGYGVEIVVGPSWGARLIERQARRNVPVLALGYVAAILRQAGHEVEVVSDGRLPYDAELVLVYSSIVESATEVRYARRLREAGSMRIGFIGPFASHRPDVYESVADFIIAGEPEVAVRALAAGDVPKGIVQSPSVQNLDELPFPDWDGFPIATYSYYPIIAERPFVTAQASRGCDFTCNYCPYLAFYGNVRKRSVENVVAEMRHLAGRHRVAGVYFRDPLFTVDQNWAMAFGRELQRSGVAVAWGCETRMEMLTEELIDVMYDAGLRGINCGIESSDNAVLRLAERRNAFAKVERMIGYCERKGIRVTAFYVFGLLSDTEESIQRTIEYAKRLNTFGAKFHVNTPFPGTPFHREIEHLIEERDWERFNACTPTFRHPALSADDLSRLRELAYVSYYLRPSYFAKHWRHATRVAFGR